MEQQPFEYAGEGILPEAALQRIRTMGAALNLPEDLAQGRWSFTGPTNMSGRIKCLAIHPSDGDIVYAGSANGGVWKTTDGGLQWRPTMDRELSLAIGGLGICESYPDVLYAATGEDAPGHHIANFPGVGVYKTIDGGGRWTLMKPIASTRTNRVLVHPKDPEVVYVAGEAGLHRYHSENDHWETVSSGHLSDAVMDPFWPEVLYIGVWNAGVYKSIDGGNTWKVLSGLPLGEDAGWIKLAIGRHGAHGSEFLLAKLGKIGDRLFRSLNGGTTWSEMPDPKRGSREVTWTSMVAVSPFNEDIFFDANDEITGTWDGGKFSQPLRDTHMDHHMLVFDPTNPLTCYLATDGGIYQSINSGRSWRFQSAGLHVTQLYSIGASETEPFLLGGATQDVGILQWRGNGLWNDNVAGSEGGNFVVDPTDSNTLYVSPEGKLKRSRDRGITWDLIVPPSAGLSPKVTQIAVHPKQSNEILCASRKQVFASQDRGDTWEMVLQAKGTICQLMYAPSNPSFCYAATSTGEVFHSAGGGHLSTWQPTAKPSSTIEKIHAIAVDWNDHRRIFAVGVDSGHLHIFHSIQAGAVWHPILTASPSSSLPDLVVTALIVDPHLRDTLYAATEAGVFRSRDSGVSWECFDQGLPHLQVSGMILRCKTNTLYVSTMGRGVYQRELTP